MSAHDAQVPEGIAPPTLGGLHSPRQKKKTRQVNNPLQLAIYNFLQSYILGPEPSQHDDELLSALKANPSRLPKRYTIYTPLLLLPSNFFPSSRPHDFAQLSKSHDQWQEFVVRLSRDDLQKLWQHMTEVFRKDGITHIAIGAPIELEYPESSEVQPVQENILRSPTGITGVFGDFGFSPSSTLDGIKENEQPNSHQFSNAFWVQSIQNGGIYQVWAPMWTMFSRGNIKEKARVLSGQSSSQTTLIAAKGLDPPRTDGLKPSPSEVAIFNGLDGVEGQLQQPLSDIAVVDMYVGIGYFAFSYLKRGVGRVYGFELNPWSVEGLRRGSEKNGWRCEVIRLPPMVKNQPAISESDLVAILGEDIVQQLRKCVNDPSIQLVVFNGDNQWAAIILPILHRLLDSGMQEQDQISTSRNKHIFWKSIRHINLGLLPSSEAAWSDVERLLSHEEGGWIHVHENVQIEGIKDKSQWIEARFRELLSRRASGTQLVEIDWKVKCVHVERVKTYAPGIMHCVFDIWISKQNPQLD